MSGFTRDEVRNLANREYILDNTTVDEQLAFIRRQIKHPFDSGDSNYFRKICKRVTDRNQLNEICESILSSIMDEFPGLEFDYDDDLDLVDFTGSVYKFFVRNIRKLVFIFLREYLYNNKNRKGIIQDFQDVKVQSYPKEVYGKKEFYLLIVKMSAIVKEITKMDFRLDTFLQYINRDDDAPMYIVLIEQYYDKGMIQDHGVYNDIMDHFLNCEEYSAIINKLTVKIKSAIIDPYLQDSGLDIARPLIVEPDDDDPEDSDEDEDAEEMDEGEVYNNE